MQGQSLTIKQVEQVCLRLRKYGISGDDAEVLSAVLLAAAEGPVPIQAADLVSLMRPKRERPVPASKDPAVIERRRVLRETLIERWNAQRGCEFQVTHHRDDRPSVVSAIQYRARKDGVTYNVEAISDTCTVVRVLRAYGD